MLHPVMILSVSLSLGCLVKNLLFYFFFMSHHPHCSYFSCFVNIVISIILFLFFRTPSPLPRPKTLHPQFLFSLTFFCPVFVCRLRAKLICRGMSIKLLKQIKLTNKIGKLSRKREREKEKERKK